MNPWVEFKYFGLYPVHVWFMPIHCDNCQYEGQGKVDKFHYGLFLFATFFILIFGFYLFSLPNISWSFGRNALGRTLMAFMSSLAGYVWYFFRPQKYHCPKCHAKEGTPLDFHRILNP